MIFGESAGATSASLHLVMEPSFGLFHAVRRGGVIIITRTSHYESFTMSGTG